MGFEQKHKLGKAEIQILGNAELSTRDISRLLKVPMGSVWGLQHRYGVGRSHHIRSDAAARLTLAKALRKKGKSVKQIASRLRVSINTARRYVDIATKEKRKAKTGEVKVRQAPQPKAANYNYCPSCGAPRIDDAQSFCVNCGGKIQ